MLGLPKSTEMRKRLPKKTVYAKFQMNSIFVFMQKIDDRKTEGLKKIIISNGTAKIVLYASLYH